MLRFSTLTSDLSSTIIGGPRDVCASRYTAGNGEDVQEDEEEAGRSPRLPGGPGLHGCSEARCSANTCTFHEEQQFRDNSDGFFFTPLVVGEDLRAALVASYFRGVFLPVDLRSVCLIRAISSIFGASRL